MTNVERFLCILNGRKPDDRLPVMEWASWWNLTLDRWAGEGLPRDMEDLARLRNLGLDEHKQFWLRHTAPGCPRPARQGGGIMADSDDYEKIRPFLYPPAGVDPVVNSLRALEPRHAAGEVALWYTLDGAFWFPRTLFGIEGHLYSFYDEPELYHRIVDDLADFHLSQLEKLYAVSTPEFMTVAEDMSYNHGPMLSRALFEEFLAPYYRRVVPYIHAHGTRVIVDSDGDVSEMVPWLEEVGVDGILPLEYQAGVDIVKLRREHPRFVLMGGFNKLIMKDGEAAMRREFERVLPVMKSGGYIPGVDHQTPPDVSLANYRLYVSLLREYAEKACR